MTAGTASSSMSSAMAYKRAVLPTPASPTKSTLLPPPSIIRKISASSFSRPIEGGIPQKEAVSGTNAEEVKSSSYDSYRNGQRIGMIANNSVALAIAENTLLFP